jgi:hypothetical protein
MLCRVKDESFIVKQVCQDLKLYRVEMFRK